MPANWLRFFGEEDPQAGGDVQETPEEDFEEHYTVFGPLRWQKSAQTIGYASPHEPCCLTCGDICFLLSWRYYDHEQKVTRQFGQGQWTTVASRDWSHSRPEESINQPLGILKHYDRAPMAMRLMTRWKWNARFYRSYWWPWIHKASLNSFRDTGTCEKPKVGEEVRWDLFEKAGSTLIYH